MDIDRIKIVDSWWCGSPWPAHDRHGIFIIHIWREAYATYGLCLEDAVDAAGEAHGEGIDPSEVWAYVLHELDVDEDAIEWIDGAAYLGDTDVTDRIYELEAEYLDGAHGVNGGQFYVEWTYSEPDEELATALRAKAARELEEYDVYA